MLKLKYLFENFEIAELLLDQYDYDDISIIKYFRISSNAIYPFKNKGQVRYLRQTPNEEQEGRFLLGELELINQLKEANYTCVEIVKSRNGNDLEQQETSEGMFYTSVFDGVKGDCIDDIEMTPDISYKMGLKLAQLHKTSVHMDVDLKTPQDLFTWIEDTLMDIGYEKDLEILYRLKDQFKTMSKEFFGIVHYDFEPDNLFYDGEEIYPIDFNDAMYNFYTMDIRNALRELEPLFHQDFLDGYCQVHKLSTHYKEEEKWCDLFYKLYKHTRIRRSIDEEVKNPPEWMQTLRIKLKNMLLEEI